jgi:tRNA(Ile)-lysidine synthase
MDEDSGRIDAPGQIVDRVGSSLVLTGRPPGTVGRWTDANSGSTASGANLFRYPLSIPGEVTIGEAGCVVSVEHRSGEAGAAFSGAVVSSGAMALVRSDLCQGGLAVRNRRPGDRFSPVGLGGRKKLQDFFVDRKVARDRRDSVPLVVDEMNRIVWVAGYSIDEAFRVTDPAQAVLILRLRQPRRSADGA